MELFCMFVSHKCREFKTNKSIAILILILHVKKTSVRNNCQRTYLYTTYYFSLITNNPDSVTLFDISENSIIVRQIFNFNVNDWIFKKLVVE